MNERSEVTLEEQRANRDDLIAHIDKRVAEDVTGVISLSTNNAKAILASLLELAEHRKRIQKAEKPVEPPIPTVYYLDMPTGEREPVMAVSQLVIWRKYIDALSAYADRMAAERDIEAAKAWLAANERAESAEADVTRLYDSLNKEANARVAAEAKLARVEKGLREARDLILSHVDLNTCMPFERKTMSDIDELLRPIEGEK